MEQKSVEIKEKQIEEMSCKKCLHYEMCLDNFRGAKEEGLWELTEEDEYFAHADECNFYAAGYRKQSEVIDEFAKRLKEQNKIYCVNENDLKEMNFVIDQIAKKMKGGGE